MNKLFFFTASVGNWACWLDIVLIVIMATIVFFHGKINYAIPSMTVEDSPLRQRVLRFSFLMTFIVGPFVECDYLFKGMGIILKTFFVYLSTYFALNVVMLIYLIMEAIVICVGKLVYWALDKKWPYD